MPDSRKKGSMTKQQRNLRRFTQLWLSANEWEAPDPMVDEKGKILAWIINRKRPL